MIAVPVVLVLASALEAVPTPAASLSPAPSSSPDAQGAIPARTSSPPPLPASSPAALRSSASRALPTVGPATAQYPYRYVPAQPAHPAADQPQIFAVYLNGKALHSAGSIDIRVITSANVVKVTTTSNGRSGPVGEVGPGDFQAHGKLPKLPAIVSGVTTTLKFTAVSQDGKKVVVGVPVRLL